MMESLFVILLIGGGIWYYYNNREKTDESGKILDRAVTVKQVLESLDEFKVRRKRDGYTESEVQYQLHQFLIQKYCTVKREKGIEGLNGTKIDFDLGDGQVGIEVKLLHALIKSTGLQRLYGQMKDYHENKYDNDNLIILIFGYKDALEESAHIKRINERIEEIGATAKYISLP